MCVVMPRVCIGFDALRCPAPFCIAPPLVCLLSQHCWFGLCLCVRVVSLWDGGDGLCVGWNGGGVMEGVVSLLCLLCPLPSSLLLVFGVVRAQLCEHARYPRTPLCSLLCLSCLLFFSFLPLPALSFVVGMAVGVFTMCRCVRWA